MGQLEITFRIGLAHDLLALATPSVSIMANIPETGNAVFIEPPDHRAVTEEQSKMGAFARFTLRVGRECTDQEGRDVGITELRSLRIMSDAAKVFRQFFETVRESDLRDGSLAGYPVARAEEIQDNVLVRTCDVECYYDGVLVRVIPLRSHPAIQITENAWNAAARRLSSQEEVAPPISFASDAAYFAQSDPIRAVIMACAAWETGLRWYLANVVPARKLDDANIPRLREFMKAAKGGDLFHDCYGHGSDAHFDRQRDCIDQLPKLRNKLLHEGRTAIPEGAALDAALSVLDAIDWLFEGTAYP